MTEVVTTQDSPTNRGWLLLAGTLVPMPANVLAGLLLARAVGPETRGVIALVLVVPLLLSGIADLGTSRALVLGRGASLIQARQAHEASRRLLLPLLRWVAVVAAIAPAAYLLVVELPATSVLGYGLLGGAYLFGAPLSQHLQSTLVLRGRFRALLLARLAEPIALLGAVTVLLLMPLSGGAATTLVVATRVVAQSGVILGLWRGVRAGRDDSAPLSDGVLIDLRATARSVVTARLGSTEHVRPEILVAGPFLSAAQTGYLAVGISLTALGKVTGAALVNLQTLQQVRSRRITVVVVVSGLIGITAGLWFSLPALVPLVFGTEYADGVQVMRLYLLIGCAVATKEALQPHLVKVGQSAAIARAEIAGLVISTVLIALLLVGGSGAFGVASASVLGQLVAVAVGVSALRWGGRREA